MNNIFAEISGWLSSIRDHVFKSGRNEPLDWSSIDETRERLVRMRFRNGQPDDINPERFNRQDDRENTELGKSLAFGGMRSLERAQITRWSQKEEQKSPTQTGQFEKQLREVIYRKDRPQSDVDSPYTPPSTVSQQAYDSLLLPGINYFDAHEANSSAPIGYIGVNHDLDYSSELNAPDDSEL
jgi:hypothetical protein